MVAGCFSVVIKRRLAGGCVDGLKTPVGSSGNHTRANTDAATERWGMRVWMPRSLTSQCLLVTIQAPAVFGRRFYFQVVAHC